MDKKVSNSSERLQELCQYYGIKQIDVANKSGLTRSAISMYFRGTREPRQSAIYAISKAYNIDPAWLMGYDVPMRKPILSEINTDEIMDLTVGKNAHLWKYVEALMNMPKQRQDTVCKMIDMISDTEEKK